MDKIIDYLQDPMETGVYNFKAIFDFSEITNYLEKLLDTNKESIEKAKEKRKISSVIRVSPRLLAMRIARLEEVLEEFKEEILSEAHFFESLTKIIRAFAILDDFPEALKSIFYRERETKMPSGKIIKRKTPKLGVPLDIFGSRLVSEVNDVLSVERKNISKGKWLFDIVTIKNDGLIVFKNCLQCLPPVKEQMEILKERRQFSTRYAFRPYPFATKLWLQDSASISVPPDLKSFLQGASNYIFSAEWRTSIVLSSISVESVLADLYEEKYKKPAPDTPLGDLFRQVKEKIDFPPEITKAIEMTNEARISAVHRSRFPVSDKEAINALYGAIKVILWYISQF